MTEAVQKLFEEAMKLSPEERECLAQQLLGTTSAVNDSTDVDDLAALEEALDESERQFAAGEGREFFSAIAELHARS